MIRFLLAFLIILSSCSHAPEKRPEKKKPRTVTRDVSDHLLKKYLHRKISRKGKYSTVTNENITTERYRREKGESVFTLENEELRTETETMPGGLILTRTLDKGKITTLTLTGTARSTLVVLDGKGNFVHKIVTEKDVPEPACYTYKSKSPVLLKSDDCVGLIPGFD